jgi:hypothetical protein
MADLRSIADGPPEVPSRHLCRPAPSRGPNPSPPPASSTGDDLVRKLRDLAFRLRRSHPEAAQYAQQLEELAAQLEKYLQSKDRVPPREPWPIYKDRMPPRGPWSIY